MKFPRYIFCLLALIIVDPFTLKAQTNASQSTRPAGPPGIMRGAGGAGFGLGGAVNVLTDQQRASFESIVGNERDRMRELQTKFRAAQQDFLAASLTQKFDENVLRQKALAMSQFEAELTVLRAKALSQVQPPLTVEQIAKIKGGQAGRAQPLRRQQLERPAQHAPTGTGTNHDANGLPPKK